MAELLLIDSFIKAFLLLFAMPSFGGPEEVRFTFTVEVSCQKLPRVVVREMAKMSMDKYELVECHEVPR